MNGYQNWGKRTFDLVLAATSVVLTSPVLFATAFAIKSEDRGPALFRQVRVGASGANFTMLKFRSMPADSPNLPSDLIGTPPLTRVGRVIRRLNIDELPQLINIIRGDMSIVGPRPALMSQAAVIQARQENGSASLRPGLTGLAQVNSFDGMSPIEKTTFDGTYALHVSLLNDLRIIISTFHYLLRPPPTY